MFRPLLQRYALVLCAAAYTAFLIVLHLIGRFPRASPYDISKLAGSPSLVFEGEVISFPQIRWNQTRFVLEGHCETLPAFRGRVVAQLNFPVPDLAPGEKIRIRGWLSRTRPPSIKRTFDERGYWAGLKTFSVLKVWSPAAMTRLEGGEHTAWGQLAWETHQRFKSFWFTHFPPDEAALISCITMGTRGIMPAAIKNQCIRAGVYHILVVSGQNVALIIAFGIACLEAFRIPRRRALWICGLPILFYSAAVGGDPPVLRAAAMAIVVLGAFALGRDVPRYIPFVLAWCWILLRQPEALFGASFQLSFGATASLLLLLPHFQKLGRIRPNILRWFAETASVSLAVHLGLWPILVYYFHQLSLIGFVANWTLFPLAGGLMIMGLAIGSWGVVSPNSLPDSLIWVLHQALKSMLFLIKVMSGWSWSAIPIPAPSVAACCIYYIVLIGILLRRRKYSREYAKKPIYI